MKRDWFKLLWSSLESINGGHFVVHDFVFFVVEGWRDLSCKLLYLCATIFYFIFP